ARHWLTRDQRGFNAVVVDTLVIQHALVAHPVAIDLHVLARAIPVHGLAARSVVREVVAAGGTTDAHRTLRAQEPDPRLEAEVLSRQRTDRANVLGHQGVGVVELTPGRQHDFTQVAAFALGEARVLGDLFYEAH